MSNQAAINPKGKAVLFAPMLRPVSQVRQSQNEDAEAATMASSRAAAERKGYESGYQVGLEEGNLEAIRTFEERHADALQAFVQELQERADRLDAGFADWMSHLEGPLVELSVIIAARIIGRELATDPETILTIAKQAVSDVTHAYKARIRVNPFDSEVLEAHKATLLAASGGLRDVEIVDDPKIIGGCVVETEGGSIDARIETMLERAVHGIRGGQ